MAVGAAAETEAAIRPSGLTLPGNCTARGSGKAERPSIAAMTIPRRAQTLAYALALGLPALTLGLAALAQHAAGPVCAEVAEAMARPGIGFLDGPAPARPACIRVRLAVAH